jgi:hypothetical protein
MKKRYIFLIVSLISVVTITYFIKSDYANTFITETKEEIEYLHNEKDSIFSYVDETINNLDIERKEKQFKLDSLDVELYEKQKIVNCHLKSIEESKKIRHELEESNEKLLKERDILEESLSNVKSELVEVIKMNETITKEKEDIYIQYSDLKQIYQNNTFVVVDTIYKIDTICYTKDEIKKLVLKNRGE